MTALKPKIKKPNRVKVQTEETTTDSGPLISARLMSQNTVGGLVLYELIVRYKFTSWITKYLGHSLIEAHKCLSGVLEGVDHGGEGISILAEWNDPITAVDNLNAEEIQQKDEE